ncbi:uncharacterized protein LOC128680259 [Plodia interpunctella]|uniref:uncharacterized protein LOC128680259 n=1 Tax=Plodia interpunctella TaxID=58824 RepID=UPI002368916E|nr:uncharacterized protein LOC128680259 [Plodia interpunctella]
MTTVTWRLMLFAVVITAGSSQHCEQLDKKILMDNPGLPTMKREARMMGKAVPIVLKYDGRAAGRAAAALLAALLEHGLRYGKVRLERALPAPLERALRSNESMYDEYKYLEMWPAAVVSLTSIPREVSCPPQVLCSTRTTVLGPGAAPAALTLLVYMTEHASSDCEGANSWPFFANKTALELCGFLELDSDEATVYYPTEYGTIAEELRMRAKTHGLLWNLKPLSEDARPRKDLLKMLRNGDQSFLFLDQEVWSSSPRVFSSQPPPCPTTTCQFALDPVYTVRLGHAFALDNSLPNVLNVFLKFAPTQAEIRQILEEEADLEEQEETSKEAACAWSVKHIGRFISWIEEEVTAMHWIAVLICQNEPDELQYERVIDQTSETIVAPVKPKIDIQYFLQDCSDDNAMLTFISTLQKFRKYRTLIGFVGSGEGASKAAAFAKDIESALVLYDTSADNYTLDEAARGVGGSAFQVAKAVARLVAGCGWARVAVLSDSSSLAKEIYEALDSNEDLVLRNVLLQTPSKIKEQLERLCEENARIFYVNTDADTALAVLCEAIELGMIYEEGYVWFVREWRAQDCSGASEEILATMRHYTVSPWWRGQELKMDGNLSDVDVNWIVRERLQKLWQPGLWPQHAASLVDALLLLTRAAEAFLTKYWTHSTDLHGRGSTRLFWSSLETVPGVTGALHPNSFQEPVMYIDEWRGDRTGPRSIGVWRMSGDVPTVVKAEMCGIREISDGGRNCITMRWYGPGDRFLWRCHDWTFLLTALVVMLAVPALVLARRTRIARLRRSERMLKAQLAARGVRTAKELGSQLVDRALLDLRHELGAGRFGRVRLAVLRAPDRPPIAVAAKALPDDATPAEERDFLREACMMASLQHSHIVRLVGVCATDGPPLVLMEYAFFGDLSEYLKSRRHLAENSGEDSEEADHVSAESLTRLGGEAASALEYLASKRLVHRDVRAANCLVDARRSLKLADFGMARQTSPSSLYWCQRRGFFPVLWMAPESLQRGVFSAASDMWALGVLMFELVTLGGRPYGAWPPQRVIRFVVDGGHPPLPPDTTNTTRDVLLSCWRRAPDSRVSARALHEYLRARRSALAPALLPPPEPDTTERAPSTLSIDAFASVDFTEFA